MIYKKRDRQPTHNLCKPLLKRLLLFFVSWVYSLSAMANYIPTLPIQTSVDLGSKIAIHRSQTTLHISQYHSKNIMNRLSQRSHQQRTDLSNLKLKYHNTTLPAGIMLHELVKQALGNSSLNFRHSTLGHFIDGQYHYHNALLDDTDDQNQTYAVTTGFDWKVNTLWLVGIGIHRENNVKILDHNPTLLRYNNTQLSFFSSFKHQTGWYINSTLLNGVSRFLSSQQASTQLTETSDSNGFEYAASMQIQHRFTIKNWIISPALSLNLYRSYAESIDSFSSNEYTMNDVDAYNLNYVVSPTIETFQSSSLDFSLTRLFNITTNTTIQPNIHIQWQHVSHGKNYYTPLDPFTLSDNHLGGYPPTFTLEQQQRSSDRTQVHLTFNIHHSRLQSFYLKTEHELNGDTLLHSKLSAGFKVFIP